MQFMMHPYAPFFFNGIRVGSVRVSGGFFNVCHDFVFLFMRLRYKQPITYRTAPIDVNTRMTAAIAICRLVSLAIVSTFLAGEGFRESREYVQ